MYDGTYNPLFIRYILLGSTVDWQCLIKLCNTANVSILVKFIKTGSYSILYVLAHYYIKLSVIRSKCNPKYVG